MATTYTGSLSGSSYIYVDTTVTELSQDIANNRTRVNVLVQLRSSSSQSYDNYGTGTLTVYIDGSVAGSASGSALNFNFANYSVKDLLNFDAWINHNSDGTKTAVFRTYINYPSGKPHGSSDVSQSIPITAIPRNSVVTAVNNTDDKDRAFSVAFTKYASYTHTLRVYTNDLTIRTITGVETSPVAVTLTDAELLNVMENWNVGGGKNGDIGFELKTFSGSTQIGAASIKTGELDIKGSMACDTGTEMKLGIPYYDDGTNWKPCIAKYDDGAVWK